MLEIKVVIILLNEDFTRIDHTHTLLALSLPFSLSLSHFITLSICILFLFGLIMCASGYCCCRERLTKLWRRRRCYNLNQHILCSRMTAVAIISAFCKSFFEMYFATV